MRTNVRIILWKAFASLLVATGCHLPSTAQSYPYIVDFENTIPGSKSYASTNPVTIDSIAWTMPGVYLGAMVNDFFNDAKAARMRLSDNETGDPGHMTMLADLTTGIGTLTFQAAMYGSETGGRLIALYSTDQGNTWMPAGDTVDVPDNNTPLTVTRTIEQTGAVRVSIRKAEAGNGRINIDDISMTEFDPQTHLIVTGKTPAGAGIPLSANELSLSFDQPVLADSGSIILFTAGASSTVFLVPDDVFVDSNQVTVPGILLDNATGYYVQVSAGAFTDTTGLLPNLAITDTVTWSFSTSDTTQAVALTTLNEDFTSCTNVAMGSFRQYNITGDKIWHCSPLGHGDSAAVEINAGTATGMSTANEDWLISTAPFDFSTMNHPELSLWQKSQFSGQVARSILISTDYAGTGDPYLASWTALHVEGLDLMPESGNWTSIAGISLDAYKAAPFYLAFTYICDTFGAYALSYDDIQVTESTAIARLNQESPALYILGQPKTDAIRLQLLSPGQETITIRVTDLSGRLIHSQRAGVHQGSNILTIHPGALQAGMYLISVKQGAYLLSVKAVLH